jgi:hypothetical protein
MQTGHRFSSDLSTGAGRSNSNPPLSPGIRREAKASWSSRTKPGRTSRAARQKKRHGILGSISSSARAQEIVKRQSWRSGFRAPTRKDRRRNRCRSRVTGRSSLRLIPHRRALRVGLGDPRQRVQQFACGTRQPSKAYCRIVGRGNQLDAVGSCERCIRTNLRSLWSVSCDSTGQHGRAFGPSIIDCVPVFIRRAP